MSRAGQQPTGYVSQGEGTGAAQHYQNDVNFVGMAGQLGANRKAEKDAAAAAETQRKLDTEKRLKELSEGGWAWHRTKQIGDLFTAYRQKGFELRKQGIDWMDPASPNYEERMRMETELERANEKSKLIGKFFDESMQEVVKNPDLYTDESKERIVQLRDTPIKEWDAIEWDKLLEKKPEELDVEKMLTDYAKGMDDARKETEGKGYIDPATGLLVINNTSSIDPAAYEEGLKLLWVEKGQDAYPGQQGWEEFKRRGMIKQPGQKIESNIRQKPSTYAYDSKQKDIDQAVNFVKSEGLKIVRGEYTQPTGLVGGTYGGRMVVDAQYVEQGNSASGIKVFYFGSDGRKVSQVLDINDPMPLYQILASKDSRIKWADVLYSLDPRTYDAEDTERRDGTKRSAGDQGYRNPPQGQNKVFTPDKPQTISIWD